MVIHHIVTVKIPTFLTFKYALQLEIMSNDKLVFNKITATTVGSADEASTPPPCEIGSKRETPDGSCVQCPAGTYGTDRITCQGCPSDNCVACPAESSSPAGSDDITDCVCLENFYRSSDTECLACPADSTAEEGADDKSDCKCRKHLFMNTDKVCQECPDNKISPAGSTSENNCIGNIILFQCFLY